MARVCMSSHADDDFVCLIKKFIYIFFSLIVRELRRRKSTLTISMPQFYHQLFYRSFLETSTRQQPHIHPFLIIRQ